MEVPGDCAVLVEGEGRGVDDDFSAPHEAILAVVDEADAAAIDLGRSLRAAGLHLVSADVEHVAEVGLHPDGTFDLDWLGAEMLAADAFVQPAVDEATATDAQALLGDPALALVEEQHRIDHLEGGDVALVDGGGQEDGLQAIQPELIGREEARIGKVETESFRVSGRDVAHLIGHHHDSVLFQNHPAVRHGAYYRFGFPLTPLPSYIKC